MPFIIPIDQAQKQYPEYKFISSLTPSEQKAAFHVQDSSGHDYCLKIISPDYAMDRLNREIIALQSLNHPNIVKLVEYTFSSKPGTQRHFIIEEFIEGNDLDAFIGQNQPWAIDKACTFFIQLFDGLEALNKNNLVHRDIKPKNIRVRPDFSPVIIDFGLARHLTLSDLTRTDEGAAIGTPIYFAPEQFRGNKHDIDHRTDVFAAGILLFEAIIGHHPFTVGVRTYEELMEAICSSEEYTQDPIFSSLPKEWQIFITRLLAKDRVKRPTAGQVVTLLKRLGEIK
jgi:serine/threonine-protein kinase